MLEFQLNQTPVHHQATPSQPLHRTQTSQAPGMQQFPSQSLHTSGDSLYQTPNIHGNNQALPTSGITHNSTPSLPQSYPGSQLLQPQQQTDRSQFFQTLPNLQPTQTPVVSQQINHPHNTTSAVRSNPPQAHQSPQVIILSHEQAQSMLLLPQQGVASTPVQDIRQTQQRQQRPIAQPRRRRGATTAERLSQRAASTSGYQVNPRENINMGVPRQTNSPSNPQQYKPILPAPPQGLAQQSNLSRTQQSELGDHTLQAVHGDVQQANPSYPQDSTQPAEFNLPDDVYNELLRLTQEVDRHQTATVPVDRGPDLMSQAMQDAGLAYGDATSNQNNITTGSVTIPNSQPVQFSPQGMPQNSVNAGHGNINYPQSHLHHSSSLTALPEQHAGLSSHNNAYPQQQEPLSLVTSPKPHAQYGR